MCHFHCFCFYWACWYSPRTIRLDMTINDDISVIWSITSIPAMSVFTCTMSLFRPKQVCLFFCSARWLTFSRDGVSGNVLNICQSWGVRWLCFINVYHFSLSLLLSYAMYDCCRKQKNKGVWSLPWQINSKVSIYLFSPHPSTHVHVHVHKHTYTRTRARTHTYTHDVLHPCTMYM